MKECTRCGEVKDSKEFRLRHEKRKGNFYYLNSTCRKCDSELARIYHNKNKDNPEYKLKNCENVKNCRLNNPDIYREKQKIKREKEESKRQRSEYIKKNKAKIQEQERICKQKWHEKNIDLLTDVYVGSKLIQKTGLVRHDLTQELIEAKREQIKLIRTLKKIKDGTK